MTDLFIAFGCAMDGRWTIENCVLHDVAPPTSAAAVEAIQSVITHETGLDLVSIISWAVFPSAEATPLSLLEGHMLAEGV